MDIPLDIKRVTQNHDKEFGDQDFITFEIEMQEPFNDSALRNIDDHFAISFHIDIDRNGLFDRVIAIDTRPDSSVSGEAPFAMVTRRVERASFYWEVGLERILAFGQVRRPTDSSFAVRFPARLLGKDGPRRFAWAARAVSRDRSDPQGVGFDYVPNSGTTSGHSSVD